MEIIINGTTNDMVKIYERPPIPTPEQDVEHIQIRGRDGSLTKKHGYKDIPIPVIFNLMEESAKDELRYIKSWILGAQTILFSDDTVYYQVKSVDVGDIENDIEEYGLFTVTFTCAPFQYMDMPALKKTTPFTLITPGTYKSLPKIKVTGSGSVTLTINGRSFQMTLTDHINIDSELGYTYRGTAGMDNKVNGELPYLDPGTNIITWSGTVSEIELEYKAVFL